MGEEEEDDEMEPRERLLRGFARLPSSWLPRYPSSSGFPLRASEPLHRAPGGGVGGGELEAMLRLGLEPNPSRKSSLERVFIWS
jgi:hypothetical protein